MDVSTQGRERKSFYFTLSKANSLSFISRRFGKGAAEEEEVKAEAEEVKGEAEEAKGEEVKCEEEAAKGEEEEVKAEAEAEAAKGPGPPFI